MIERSLTLTPGPEQVVMFGSQERYLKALRDRLAVRISARGGVVRISGEDEAVDQAVRVIETLSTQTQPLDAHELDELIADAALATPDPISADRLSVYLHGRSIRPRTSGQRDYIQAILDHDLTFCIGPAGTGKTYLAVAAAVAMLKAGKLRKLVLCRPAVEAGEKLGFLPGDMFEKVNPFLRPLLDALHDTMEFEQVQRLIAGDVVEVVPLAFMRGRTLNDALIILDEAQNTSRSQMLMFLTRMGQHAKMVVTGDASQIDLPDPKESGLIDAARRLRRVPGVAWVTLGKSDIVRHRLVQRIIEAYGHDEKSAQLDRDIAEGV